VGPRAGLDDVERRKFLTLPGLELWHLGRPGRSQWLYRLRYFFLVSCGGGETASKWLIVPAPDDRWWWVWSNWWNENWQGKPKYSEKTCPGANLSTTNLTWRILGSNPGRRHGKPATMARPYNRYRSRAECLGILYAERQYLCLCSFNGGLRTTFITEHRIGVLPVFFTSCSRLKAGFIVFSIIHDLLALFPVLFWKLYMPWYLGTAPFVSTVIRVFPNTSSSVLTLTPRYCILHGVSEAHSGPKSWLQIHDFDPEDLDCIFFRNVGNGAKFSTVQMPKRTISGIGPYSPTIFLNN
jgi:hypothetical protein